MAIPSTSYMQINNGVQSDIFTTPKIKVGDTIKITGTVSNNGIYLVAQIIDNLNQAADAVNTFTTSFQDNTQIGDLTGSGTEVVMDGANTKIVAGLKVTGSRIQSGTYIASVTQTSNPATFVINQAWDGTIGGSTTLTFKNRDVFYVLKGKAIVDENSEGSTDLRIQVIRPDGDKLVAFGERGTSSLSPGVSIWSESSSTSPGTNDNGWTQLAIKPTLNGTDAKYIYHFVDEVLRVCDTNINNTSIVKWYGYIQKDQFTSSYGATFSEWQEQPNNLRSPESNSSGISISFGTSTHDDNTAGAWYAEPTDSGNTFSRGVARKFRDSGHTALQLSLDPDGATTAFTFDDGTNEHLDQSYVGEVISIGTDYNVVPTEFLFCTKSAAGNDDSITYSRSYGGALAGTAPTDYADNDTPILRRGVGWNIGVDNGTSEGNWEGKTYEFYQTFIYDGNQESLPVKMGNGAATIADFTHAQTAGKTMRISIYADLVYNARISGGRIYIREQNTDDELILLVDIDIVKGIRTTIDGEHVSWVVNDLGGSDVGKKGFCVIADATGNSSGPNLDSYTTINGFSPDVQYIALGGLNEGYQASIVENRRTFIANVKVFGETAELETHGDRIMYSEINKFDTFLPFNFIDVSKGDYGVYTALESYADRLLAFKHSIVHIINISSPSPANWYLEDTIKHNGVNHHYSVARTAHGIAWVSEAGAFLYDGRQVKNLSENRIAISKSSFDADGFTWQYFYRGYSNLKDPLLGYDAISNSLVMTRSPQIISSGNTNDGFIYDFDSNAWVIHNSIFADASKYSNFVTDWNNNLTVISNSSDGDTGAATVSKFLPVNSSTGVSNQRFYTKDIDFNQPGVIKKIYKILVTYKCVTNDDSTLSNPFSYSINGSQTFTGSLTGSMLGDVEDWDITTLTPSSPISCQSIQIHFDDGGKAGQYEINDMTIEYRVIANKKVS